MNEETKPAGRKREMMRRIRNGTKYLADLPCHVTGMGDITGYGRNRSGIPTDGEVVYDV